MVEDIIKLLRKKDPATDFAVLAMPWYYNINSIETEEQRIGNVF